METEIDSNDGALPGAEEPKQTVGPQLKAERERQGFTEKEVADRLHITMHYVRSLETDGYEKLPGIVFARGYIKSYALLLGLNKDDLVAQFDAMVEERKPPQQTRTFINPGRRGNKQNQAVVWLLIAILAFLAGFLVFWSYNRLFATDQDQVAEVLSLGGRAPFDILLGDAGSVSLTLNQLDVPVTDNIRIDNTARLLVSI